MNRMRIVLAVLTAGFPVFGMAAQLLVLNKGDSTLAFIDPASGKISATIATGEGPHEIELSPDGKLAFVSNYGSGRQPGNTLSVIDVAKRTESKRVELGELKRPHGLTFANGGVYFTAQENRRIGRYDPKTQRVDWTFATDQDSTHMVLAARDGSRLFATNIDSNSISIIERVGDTWKQTLVAVGAGPEALDVSPDGRELWTAHSRDGGISVIDVAGKKVLQQFDAKTRRSNRLKFTADGATVLVSDMTGGELVVLDASKRIERTRLKVGRMPTGILIAPDGMAYVALSGENQIAVVDPKTMTIERTIATGTSPDGMAWVK